MPVVYKVSPARAPELLVPCYIRTNATAVDHRVRLGCTNDLSTKFVTSRVMTRVAASSPRTPRDAHVRSYRELCDPCRVEYDFIGHHETLFDDVRLLLQRLGVGRKVALSAVNRLSATIDPPFPVSPEQIDAALEELTTDDISALRQRLKADFAMFGYQ
jgi:dermatan 4-sulfotransferase 1